MHVPDHDGWQDCKCHVVDNHKGIKNLLYVDQCRRRKAASCTFDEHLPPEEVDRLVLKKESDFIGHEDDPSNDHDSNGNYAKNLWWIQRGEEKANAYFDAVCDCTVEMTAYPPVLLGNIVSRLLQYCCVPAEGMIVDLTFKIYIKLSISRCVENSNGPPKPCSI